MAMLQIHIPKDIYHLTRLEFLDDILKNGLIPNKEKCSF